MNNFSSKSEIEKFVLETLVAHYKACPIKWPINQIPGYPEDYDGFYIAQAYRGYAKIQNIKLEYDWDEDLIIPEEFKNIWEQKRRNWETEIYQAALSI